MQEAKYVALRDFDGFKMGDSIPAEFVQDRLIRGRKIGLVNSEVVEAQEIKEELITEVIETVQSEELLLEDSSDVSVEIKEEVIPEVLEISEVQAQETQVKITKKSKK